MKMLLATAFAVCALGFATAGFAGVQAQSAIATDAGCVDGTTEVFWSTNPGGGIQVHYICENGVWVELYNGNQVHPEMEVSETCPEGDVELWKMNFGPSEDKTFYVCHDGAYLPLHSSN